MLDRVGQVRRSRSNDLRDATSNVALRHHGFILWENSQLNTGGFNSVQRNVLFCFVFQTLMFAILKAEISIC